MNVLTICFVLTAVVSASALNLYPFIRPQFSSGDIISGVPAENNEAPYIISLKTSSHFCAGSLIDPNWILTAGHCLVYSSFKAVAGLHKRNDESQVQIREISLKNSIQHELYNGDVGPNDIGLIYVDPPFDLSEISRASGKPIVAKVNLPSRQYSQLGDGVLFGWGMDNSNKIPNTLQKLDTNIIDYKTCKNLLPSSAPLHKTSNICSHNGNTIASACNGDSGGPLVKYNGDDVELIGIVSWGYTPCTSTTYPSVYTHTDAFTSWIAKQQKNFVPTK